MNPNIHSYYGSLQGTVDYILALYYLAKNRHEEAQTRLQLQLKKYVCKYQGKITITENKWQSEANGNHL